MNTRKYSGALRKQKMLPVYFPCRFKIGEIVMAVDTSKQTTTGTILVEGNTYEIQGIAGIGTKSDPYFLHVQDPITGERSGGWDVKRFKSMADKIGKENLDLLTV